MLFLEFFEGWTEKREGFNWQANISIGGSRGPWKLEFGDILSALFTWFGCLLSSDLLRLLLLRTLHSDCIVDRWRTSSIRLPSLSPILIILY
jgi:hypothetical protein